MLLPWSHSQGVFTAGCRVGREARPAAHASPGPAAAAAPSQPIPHWREPTQPVQPCPNLSSYTAPEHWPRSSLQWGPGLSSPARQQECHDGCSTWASARSVDMLCLHLHQLPRSHCLWDLWHDQQSQYVEVLLVVLWSSFRMRREYRNELKVIESHDICFEVLKKELWKDSYSKSF